MQQFHWIFWPFFIIVGASSSVCFVAIADLARIMVGQLMSSCWRAGYVQKSKHKTKKQKLRITEIHRYMGFFGCYSQLQQREKDNFCEKQ